MFAFLLQTSTAAADCGKGRNCVWVFIGINKIKYYRLYQLFGIVFVKNMWFTKWIGSAFHAQSLMMNFNRKLWCHWSLVFLKGCALISQSLLIGSFLKASVFMPVCIHGFHWGSFPVNWYSKVPSCALRVWCHFLGPKVYACWMNIDWRKAWCRS